MSIALIGAGYWGKNLLRDLNSLDVLKSVCEIKNIENLNLDGNKISDISHLGNMKNAEKISLKDQEILLKAKETKLRKISIVNPIKGVYSDDIKIIKAYDRGVVKGNVINWSGLKKGEN